MCASFCRRLVEVLYIPGFATPTSPDPLPTLANRSPHDTSSTSPTCARTPFHQNPPSGHQTKPMFTVVSSPILTETLRSKLLPITQPPHLRNHVRSKESNKQISSRVLFFFLQLECARKPSAEPRTECANVEVALGLLYLIPRL